MNFARSFFPPHAFRFKGGASAGSQPYAAYTPPPTAPVIQTPAPPAPPATNSAIEVTQARIDAKRTASKKKGLASTILAGAGGSAASEGSLSSPTGKNTLLGGG
jgi:hypothetical protein